MVNANLSIKVPKVFKPTKKKKLGSNNSNSPWNQCQNLLREIGCQPDLLSTVVPSFPDTGK